MIDLDVRIAVAMVLAAVATGEARVSQDALPVAGCTVLELDAGGTAYASDPDGVNAIFFGPQMQTSTGLRIGATLAEVLAAYPGAWVAEPDGPDPKVRVGEDACPFTAGYWWFLDRHRETFAGNHRMSRAVHGLDRLEDLEGLVAQEDARGNRAP